MDISRQKYKIWVNTGWVIFLPKKRFSLANVGFPQYLLLQNPRSKEIISRIEQLQAGVFKTNILVLSDDLNKTWLKVLKSMPIIEAAGGLVQRRTDNKYLFIYRRGSWDLPKGKIDKGETVKKAALREVIEEVGLSCTITKSLPDSYHTYFDKGLLVLKKTYWFEMICAEQKVKLQYEEDIEKSKWIKLSDLHLISKKMYPNLAVMLGEARS